MNIYSLICTRSREDISPTTDKLLSFLAQGGVKTYLISGSSSIFSSYYGGVEKIDPDPEDLIIFCHDDIEIRENPSQFIEKLKAITSSDETGFVGPAGTTCLGPDAVWWDQGRWQQGLHKGKVTHIDPNEKEYLTYYGPPDDVVVLDGLFLAARAKVIRDIGLQKPEYFEGEWDFYDIHYTSKAFLQGYTNKVLDMNILHNSRGELVGRDSWHKNRLAFIEKTDLPLKLHK